MAPYRRILNNDDEGDATPTPATSPPPPPPPLLPLPPPPPPFLDDQHGRRLVNFLLIAAAVVAAALLLSLTYYAVLRRRRRPLSAAAVAGPGGDDDDAASLGEGEPFHHVWYIRTVGLDESTIGSIAVAEYRAGDGLLDGASNCSVCLGEFCDGERVRLLPKCGHAFHAPCIDTWLRTHVNCPLCRAHIVDSNAEPLDPAAALAPSVTASGGSVDSDSLSSASAEDPQIRIQPLEEEQNGGVPENMIDIGIPINPSEMFDPPPESSASRVQSDLSGFRLQPVRRSVSMDTPLMNAIIVRVEPEETIIDEEGKDANFEEESVPKNRGKQGNSSKGVVDQKGYSDIERSLSSSGRGFFFSRHGRVARIHSMPM